MNKNVKRIVCLALVFVFLMNVGNLSAYYNPTNGRFNRMDPYAGDYHNPQSLHKYVYCNNNSVNRIDPSGKLTTTEVNVTATIQLNIGASIAFNAFLLKEYVEYKTSASVLAKNLNARILSRTDLETKLPGGYTYFVHGASTHSWLGQTRIDVATRPYNRDFGQGLYTFTLSDTKSIPSAIEWAYKQSPNGGFNQPFLMVVRYPNANYMQLNKLALEEENTWRSYVQAFRRGEYPGPTGYDEIYGWTAAFPREMNVLAMTNPVINRFLPQQHKFEQSGINKGMQIYGIVPLPNRIQKAGY